VPGPKPEAEQEVVSPAGAPPSSAGPDVEPGAGVEPEVVDAAELEVVDDAEPVPQAEPVDLADKYLDLAQRTQADFDNYRKRMTREVRAAEARGIGKLARELLPALDNLERALAAVQTADPDHHLSQGVRLLSAELSAALGRTGIQGYDPTGEVFDPVQHEAVAQQPVEGAESGTVVQVLQSGYRFNETILRPARVIVAA
jgi:molecular chaperone GrpE